MFGECTDAPCLEPMKCKNCGETVPTSDVEDVLSPEGADRSDSSPRDKDDPKDAENSEPSSDSEEDASMYKP